MLFFPSTVCGIPHFPVITLGSSLAVVANHVTQSYPMGEGFLCVYSLKDCSHCGREGRTVDCDVSSVVSAFGNQRVDRI